VSDLQRPGPHAQGARVRHPGPPRRGRRDALQYPGEGEAGALGGPPGDLYVFFPPEAPSRFEREDRDLLTEIPISFAQAALGDEIEVTNVGGEKATLTIPEGTQTGTSFRLRGLGMPDVHSRSAQGRSCTYPSRWTCPPAFPTTSANCCRQFASLRGERLVHEQKSIFERVKEAVKEAVVGHDE
jgi:molecular chaperone DnaJ